MKKGFTLVELLLYMGLLAIFLVITTQLFTAILDVQLGSVATSSVEGDSRYIFNRISFDITRAGSIVTPASIGSTTSSLTLTIGGVANTYSLNGTNLVLINDSGTNPLNSFDTSVTNLSFLRLGPTNGKDSIQIKFTITSLTQVPSGPETKNVEFTIAQR